ncbi:MAG: LLM class F420-dependent oxidoreductase [Chloroflexi bacterium]|nr:LLM class F420-dependent oxidoreductase [Chloroflexota bacterium]
MDIGVSMAILSQSIDIAVLAEKAESLGFESLWLPEHPIMPVNPASKYAGTADGSIPPAMGEMADPYIALARASGVTHDLKLATGISLIPERNPLVLAKEIATLDLFSGGRFILGIGTGWLREETEVMGGDFEHRWTQARESIQAMKELWTKEEAEFHGKYYDFPPVKCYPKPVQKPHPPVLLGGSAKNVFKRVVAWGDGWLPIASEPEQIKAGRAALDELADAAGRDPKSIQITVFGVRADAETIQGFEAAGADRVIVRLPSTSDESCLTELEQMAAQALG